MLQTIKSHETYTDSYLIFLAKKKPDRSPDELRENCTLTPILNRFDLNVVGAVRVDRAGEALAPRVREVRGLRHHAQREMFRARRSTVLQGGFLQVGLRKFFGSSFFNLLRKILSEKELVP